ncbi:MAG TPA: hypothetical protein VKG43_14335 [Acidimicrobiales bacterium]|nr:hypothetical protein [Acidimicrobiales bacterium]
MWFLKTVSVVAGLLVIGAVLGSALQTVVLPRLGFTRISQFVFGLVHRLMVHRVGSKRRQEARLSLFAPVALVSLPLAWILLVTLGFALIYWGLNAGSGAYAIDVSGSSLLTLGFTKPSNQGLVWITFVEATIGLGLVALLISYLPVIYGAYNVRERGMKVLRPFAGTPPSAIDFLQRLEVSEAVDNQDTWTRISGWLVDLEESHTSFPALTYFPNQSSDQSWVATAGAAMEAAALVLSVGDAASVRADPGPVLVMTYGCPALANVARAAGLPVAEAEFVTDLITKLDEPPPPISVTRQEFEETLPTLSSLGLVHGSDPEMAWRRYAWLRSNFDKPLRGLAGLTGAPPAPRTTDRPARVGRPRLTGRRPLPVDWSPGLPVASPSG